MGKSTDIDTKECPYCAEIIKKKAIVCRFCGRDLTQIENVGIKELTDQTSAATTKANIRERHSFTFFWLIFSIFDCIVPFFVTIPLIPRVSKSL